MPGVEVRAPKRSHAGPEWPASAESGPFNASVSAGPCGFDAIDDFQVRSRSGFENIGADARSAIGATVVFNRQQCLALRILADGHTVHFERAYLDMNSGGMVDGFDHGVDGSVGGVIMGDDTPIDVREPDCDARRLIVVCGNAQRLQRPRPRGFAVRAQDERFDVPVEELLLFVG